jgi:hypothetical protein
VLALAIPLPLLIPVLLVLPSALSESHRIKGALFGGTFEAGRQISWMGFREGYSSAEIIIIGSGPPERGAQHTIRVGRYAYSLKWYR